MGKLRELLAKLFGNSGWVTNSGISIGVVAGVATLAGLDLTTEQLGAVLLIVNSIIGWGLRRNGERIARATATVSAQTSVVSQQVAKIEKIPERLLDPSLGSLHERRAPFWPNK